MLPRLKTWHPAPRKGTFAERPAFAYWEAVSQGLNGVPCKRNESKWHTFHLDRRVEIGLDVHADPGCAFRIESAACRASTGGRDARAARERSHRRPGAEGRARSTWRCQARWAASRATARWSAWSRASTPNGHDEHGMMSGLLEHATGNSVADGQATMRSKGAWSGQPW